MFSTTGRWLAGLAAALLMTAASWTSAQIVIPPDNGDDDDTTDIGGVYIDPQGAVRYREAGGKAEMDRIRALAKNVGKDEQLRFVSLAKTLQQARELIAAGKPLTDEVKYLGGLTRIQYVLLYPEDKDLVLAGTGEDFDAKNPLQAFGTRTGRPVMQLDDLVVALRLAHAPSGQFAPFGCSIDADGDLMAKARPVLDKYAKGGSKEKMAQEMKAAVGPQKVTVFGAAANTRLAFITVAADYKMKRMSLGFDPSPIGHAVDNSRAAGNRFWFETSYEPLLVSPDANAYELRGQRLQIKAGQLMFQEQGATDHAQKWAKAFNEKMGQMAASTPLFADLQNISDLSVLAALIKADKLDQKVGMDLGWVLDAKSYPVREVRVPQTADTLVGQRSGSVVCGGVSVNPAAVITKTNRQTDNQGALAKVKQNKP